MQRFADGQLHGAAAISSRLPAMRYGDVTFELADDEGHVLTWPAVVALTAESVIPTSGFVMVPRQSSRGGKGQANFGQGNWVVDDFCGQAEDGQRMDSGIPAWILVPYIRLPEIHLPLNLPAHSLALKSFGRDWLGWLSPDSARERSAVVRALGRADGGRRWKTIRTRCVAQRPSPSGLRVVRRVW